MLIYLLNYHMAYSNKLGGIEDGIEIWDQTNKNLLAIKMDFFRRSCKLLKLGRIKDMVISRNMVITKLRMVSDMVQLV